MSTIAALRKDALPALISMAGDPDAMNAVEGFVSALTRRRLKWGSFRGIVNLRVEINRFVAEPNDGSVPFV